MLLALSLTKTLFHNTCFSPISLVNHLNTNTKMSSPIVMLGNVTKVTTVPVILNFLAICGDKAVGGKHSLQ